MTVANKVGLWEGPGYRRAFTFDNIDLCSENYAVDDKFQCNIVYLFLTQDIIVVQCGNIVIRSEFQFSTK